MMRFRYLAEPIVVACQQESFCAGVRVYANGGLIMEMSQLEGSHTYREAMAGAIHLADTEVSLFGVMEEISGYRDNGLYL